MSLKDDLLKHKIFTLRYADTLAENLKVFLNKSTNIALGVIKQNENGVSKRQLDALHNKLLDSVNLEIENQFDALDKLMRYEVKFISKILIKHNMLDNVVQPSDDRLKKALINTRMGIVSGENDKAVRLAYKQFLNKKIKEIILVVGDLSVTVR